MYALLHLFSFCHFDVCDTEALGNNRGGHKMEDSWHLNDLVEGSCL